MIITKKEFKDAVKKIIVQGINNTKVQNVTQEENRKADKQLVTTLTEYYEKLTRSIFCGDCWTYSKNELLSISHSILEDREDKTHNFLTFIENLACLASTH